MLSKNYISCIIWALHCAGGEVELPPSLHHQLPGLLDLLPLSGTGHLLHCNTLPWPRSPAALHCTVIHYHAHHLSAQHCDKLHYRALHCSTMHCTVINYHSQHWSAMHCTTLYQALHCSTLHSWFRTWEQGQPWGRPRCPLPFCRTMSRSGIYSF